nr:tetratricopeptide repeat protein [uncultured Methanobrevibacter sp.]
MRFNVPDELEFEVSDNRVRFTVDDLSTGWMGVDDSFIRRVEKDKLNPDRLVKHLKKEIEMKNVLDEGISFLKAEKYLKAIEKFDEVLFYDPCYGEALLQKSFSLRRQRHFVKSLRYYKKAIKSDETLSDIEYHKALLRNANEERDNFPKLKLNIYAGDEYFSRGDFESAVKKYDVALANPSKFKDKILSKLLNKKATALLRLNDYDGALECFLKSLDVGENDYAVFGEGYCQYKLGLNVDDKFLKPLNITKKEMLTQAIVLGDLGYSKQSLDICEYLLENHFTQDEFYMKLMHIMGNV